MTIFGLTGGIACGKSSVAEIFRNAGVPMVGADEVARSLVYPGSPVLQEIVRHFGADLLLEDGNLNRHKLGALVFGDPKKMDLLNDINRKPVLAAIDSTLKEANKTASLVGYDCALIVETGQQGAGY
jgi:dephospho-CoA kinase